LTVDIDLRSLRGHELAFLIVIMTDARTALLNVFPPLGFELLKVLENELRGRAEKLLGEWRVTMTFDYDADTVLRQTQAAGQWCDAVLAQVTQHEGFENVTALLESLRSQLAKAVAEMLDRRRLFDSDDAPLGIDGFRGKVYNTIKRLLNRPSELKGDGHGQRRLPASGRLLRYL